MCISILLISCSSAPSKVQEDTVLVEPPRSVVKTKSTEKPIANETTKESISAKNEASVPSKKLDSTKDQAPEETDLINSPIEEKKDIIPPTGSSSNSMGGKDSSQETTQNLNAVRKINSVNRGILEVERALSKENDKELIQILKNHPEPEVRSKAALALGKRKKGRETIESVLQTDGFLVREASLEALTMIGDPKNINLFVQCLKSEAINLKVLCVKGLANTKDPSARQAIKTIGLNSEIKEVLIESIKALGSFKITEDIYDLERYVNDIDKDVNYAALTSLSNHGSYGSIQILENVVYNYPPLRNFSIFELSNSKSPYAIYSLVRLSQQYEKNDVIASLAMEEIKRKRITSKFVYIIMDKEYLRELPDESSSPTAFLSLYEIAEIVKKSNKKVLLNFGGDRMEGEYYQLKVEDKYEGNWNEFKTGWIFNGKIKEIDLLKRIPSKQ